MERMVRSRECKTDGLKAKRRTLRNGSWVQEINISAHIIQDNRDNNKIAETRTRSLRQEQDNRDNNKITETRTR